MSYWALCGFLGGLPVYRLDIHVDTYQRLVLLSKEGVEGIPDWLDWGQSTVASKRVIATMDPGWFEREERAAHAESGKVWGK